MESSNNNKNLKKYSVNNKVIVLQVMNNKAKMKVSKNFKNIILN